MGKKKEEFVWDFSEVPDAAIIAEAGRRRQKMGHRPKVPTACKHCGKIFGAAEVRRHWPVCPKKPIRGTARGLTTLLVTRCGLAAPEPTGFFGCLSDSSAGPCSGRW